MITLRSPAKINLFLRILGKRSDGYHELASLFQAISLYDTLHFTLASVDSLTCTDSFIPTDANNLVNKAIALFRKKTNLNHSVQVHLEKKIPSEAGLGGGSGNAATTLWALNELFGKPATPEELKLWGAEIGSDIPFFFSQGTAYCTGRGEKIRELPPLPPQNLWIVKPTYGLSTPSVYQRFDQASSSTLDPEYLLKCFQEGNPQLFNDLEKPAFSLLPQLGELKQELQVSGDHVLLSGSGTSFFCLTDDAAPAHSQQTVCHSASFVRRSLGEWY